MINKSRESVLRKLLSRCSLKIKNLRIINHSLTHSSYVNEHKNKKLQSNEKLEFLGDSVIGLVISEYLFRNYPDYSEGKLSKIKGRLVSATVLAKKSRELNLGSYLLLGKGEDVSGGRNRVSILADTYEAFIGAVYLEVGFKEIYGFLTKYFVDEISQIKDGKIMMDYKSRLQEIVQKIFRCAPHYKVIKEKGPQHKRIFEVEVSVKNKILGNGIGSSKKSSEQEAAKAALKIFE